MISIACQRPAELGYAQELWTLASLHKYIQKHAEEAGYPRLSTVTKPYIQKFLREQDMKPFKIKYYCEKRDPDFETKMHEVLLVYKQIEMQFDENGDLIVPDDYKLTITVSYDEKDVYKRQTQEGLLEALKGTKTIDLIGQETGESSRQVLRYVLPLFGRSLFFCPYMNWIKEGVYENTDSPFMHALMNFVFIS